jgi:hypothetical protein
MSFSLEELIDCLTREVRYRERYLPGRVAKHRMTQAKVNKEIAMMQFILDDYRQRLKAMEPELDYQPVTGL